MQRVAVSSLCAGLLACAYSIAHAQTLSVRQVLEKQRQNMSGAPAFTAHVSNFCLMAGAGTPEALSPCNGSWGTRSCRFAYDILSQGQKYRVKWQFAAPHSPSDIRTATETFDGAVDSLQETGVNKAITGKTGNSAGHFGKPHGTFPNPITSGYDPFPGTPLSDVFSYIVEERVSTSDDAAWGQIAHLHMKGESGSTAELDIATQKGYLVTRSEIVNGQIRSETKIDEIVLLEGFAIPSRWRQEIQIGSEPAYSTLHVVSKIAPTQPHAGDFSMKWTEKATVMDSDRNIVYLVVDGRLVPHPMFNADLQKHLGQRNWLVVAAALAALFLFCISILTWKRSIRASLNSGG